MSKLILEFDWETEKDFALTHTKALDYEIALRDIREEIRTVYKYNANHEKVLDNISKLIAGVLDG